ncbi:histidine kinase [Mucilaginibacter auburnensis]|uniref:histidine kinase n=1 Tax=Mucilaginibacter auburnensis TaxID=1457233 RepID=A0A2H9VPN2_9SPHI|nr:histidine kinase [Mucilaginibacter auburnensis]
MSIKTLILLIINSLIVLVIALLSFLFYKQFSNVLNDRILMQLNSIETLESIQIEKLIKTKWNSFASTQIDNSDIDSNVFRLPDSVKAIDGIHDLTSYHKDKKATIGFILNTEKGRKIEVIDYSDIQNILLERTGMGKSGETYLVGQDFRMRSESRFFPHKKPYDITVKTKGVISALKGVNGRGILDDYRGIPVYSVHSLIKISNLKLVILSEIDVSEVTKPLDELKRRLTTLTFVIFLVAVTLSLFLTRIIIDPIKNMRNSLRIMAKGDYHQTIEYKRSSSEIKEMFDALSQLKASLQGAVKFSEAIGNMDLTTNYQPNSANDVLGKSLLTMRDKLIDFKHQEDNSRTISNRLLVNGLENERRRLSRELHDGVGPYLISLKYYIENNVENALEKTEMKRIVDETISEIRSMSNALMPASIDDFGIGVTLTNYIENLNRSTSISIEYEDLTRQENSNITNHQAINLFRICQELLNNSIKHSKAKNIRITLSEFDEFISLFYFDDGIGFDINTVKLGSGITNIKERVDICNGEVTINALPGNTTFEIELPIEL